MLSHVRRGLLALLAVVVVGCGSDAKPVAHTPVPTALPDCGEADVGATPIRFRTADGVRLAGAETGSGPVGAVLIHEYPLDHCGWLPYAGYLASRGIHTLALDLRCFGHSACPDGRGHTLDDVRAAVEELKRRGAQSVALIGASMGGAIALTAAAALHPSAVVSLSGEKTLAGLTPGIDDDASAAASRIRSPALLAVAAGDQYVTVAETRQMARRVHSSATRVIALPARAGHGWDLLAGDSTVWSPTARTVAAFILRHAA
jgi:pimeloyl-ACP methyl ester carboxylesterase